MAYKYTNFVEGILDADGGGINDSTTSIAVDFATNSVVPTGLSGSNYMMFVIDPEGAEHAPEVVKATAISGSSNPYTLTVTRNQESSGAKAFDQGRKIVGAVTAAQLTNFATKDATVFTGDVTIPDGDLILGSTAVTSTAAELNKLDGATVTTAELNYLDNDDLVAADITKLAAITADAADINVLDGVTGGTVTASKALVVDGNKDLASLRNVTLTGTLTVDSVGITAIQIDSESFANNNTSLMTSASIEDKILSYGYTTNTGNTTIHFASSAPSAGGAGELWIKTS